MAWRFVKQPNGLFARFSTVVDDFTHMNLTEEQAMDICLDLGLTPGTAKAKIVGARNDILENQTCGDGLSRWREALDTIEMVHGAKRARSRVEPRRRGRW